MSGVVYTDTQQGRCSRILPDLIRARGLLWDLISKDFRARYRDARVGVLWAVLHPLLMTLVLWLVFGVILQFRVAERGIATEDPFAVFLLCGIVPWQFLAAGLAAATASLVRDRDLIKKVYFPREVIPLAAVGSCLVGLVVGLAVLVAARLATGGGLSFGALWALPVLAVQCVFMAGLALLLSAVHVRYRDVLYIVEILLAFGFYATPIFYPLSLVEERLPLWLAEHGAPAWLAGAYFANPMAGLVTAYRQAFLGNRMPDADLLVWPIACACVVLVAGAVVFRRSAPAVADHL
ncbi:MAG: ABC transporter permease [Candidatus Hydrogenedentes bacterium]|nr:ABC transporter permease [Candidatus Hydrogenedentota bacterium]